ncbi:hypothetical protein Fmac_017977 [Flemingia macrophylla]|uniref:Uncharacterized protein n=1 Tax=Flemingia macrophylla TaxID=520843 RepID=A0ABD1M3S4_9FABA
MKRYTYGKEYEGLVASRPMRDQFTKTLKFCIMSTFHSTLQRHILKDVNATKLLTFPNCVDKHLEPYKDNCLVEPHWPLEFIIKRCPKMCLNLQERIIQQAFQIGQDWIKNHISVAKWKFITKTLLSFP